MNATELIGKKFGRLTILLFSHTKSRNQYFKCGCDCGNEVTVRYSSIYSGNTKSCGCILKEKLIKRNLTHGKSNTSEYNIRLLMIARCYNPKNNRYQRYGGRGIVVCQRWM